MNFIDKLKQKIDTVAAAIKEAENSVENLFVPEPVHNTRLDICMSCEHLFKATNQCKKCGCFVKIKTQLASFKCPIDKWDKYDIDV